MMVPSDLVTYQSLCAVIHVWSNAVWFGTQSSSTFRPSACAASTKALKSALVPNSGLTAVDSAAGCGAGLHATNVAAMSSAALAEFVFDIGVRGWRELAFLRGFISRFLGACNSCHVDCRKAGTLSGINCSGTRTPTD